MDVTSLGKTEEEREEIDDKFQKIAEAHEVLSSTELRRKYDNEEVSSVIRGLHLYMSDTRSMPNCCCCVRLL